MDLPNKTQKIADREMQKHYELSDKAQRSALPDSFTLITSDDVDKAKYIIESLRSKGWDVYCVAHFQNPQMQYKYKGEIKTAEEYRIAFSEELKRQNYEQF